MQLWNGRLSLPFLGMERLYSKVEVWIFGNSWNQFVEILWGLSTYVACLCTSITRNCITNLFVKHCLVQTQLISVELVNDNKLLVRHNQIQSNSHIYLVHTRFALTTLQNLSNDGFPLHFDKFVLFTVLIVMGWLLAMKTSVERIDFLHYQISKSRSIFFPQNMFVPPEIAIHSLQNK